jgi:hydrogenase maturation protease
MRHIPLMRTAVNESSNSSELLGHARPLLLLGLGNDILTDDAIGLLVVRELRAKLAGHPSIDFRETTEMGLALLDFITGYRTVVIADSIQTGKAPPGFLHELEASALHELTGRTPHFVGVSETLALGRQLGLAMPEQVRIFAIEVEDPFTLGTALTPTLQSALPGIVQRIADSLQALI